MQSADKTKLTKSVTVARYRAMAAAGDREGCGRFIVERFHERYFEPTIDADTRHGFTLMAIGCLVIEALESFYQGRPTSDGKAKQMFASFFEKRTLELKRFSSADDWFYYKIRCAILHQSETTGGWRLRRKGPLLDPSARAINAKKFVVLLREAVAHYAKNLETDDDLWAKFKTKMAAVCANCETRP